MIKRYLLMVFAFVSGVITGFARADLIKPQWIALALFGGALTGVLIAMMLFRMACVDCKIAAEDNNNPEEE